jgi:hypothetical protein
MVYQSRGAFALQGASRPPVFRFGGSPSSRPPAISCAAGIAHVRHGRWQAGDAQHRLATYRGKPVARARSTG